MMISEANYKSFLLNYAISSLSSGVQGDLQTCIPSLYGDDHLLKNCKLPLGDLYFLHTGADFF